MVAKAKLADHDRTQPRRLRAPASLFVAAEQNNEITLLMCPNLWT